MKRDFALLLALILIFINSDAQNGHLTRHILKLKQHGIAVQMLNATDARTVWGLACVNSPTNTSTALRALEMEAVRSTDGGMHWKSFLIPGTSLVDSMYVSSFWPIDSGVAYLGLYNTATGGGKILKTGDGGSSWQPLSLPAGAFLGGFLDFLYFFSPDSGLAVGDPTGGCFEIYTTSDAGRTWTRVSNLNIPASLPGEYGPVKDFMFTRDSLYFISVCQSGRRLFASGDRGRTWSAEGPTTNAVFNQATNVNDGYRFVCGSPYSGADAYYYSNDYGQSSYSAYYPDTTGTNQYGSIFRTRADNTYIVGKVCFDSLYSVDSICLYMCNGALNAPFNWVRVLSTTSVFDVNDEFVNFFYDQNNGWLTGDTYPDSTQTIYRYQNCALNPQPLINTFDLTPGKLCKGIDTINLNHYYYARPPGGSYVINRAEDSLITPSAIASDPYYPYLFIYYDYRDAAGCEAQYGTTLNVDTSHTAPALSHLAPISVCLGSLPIVLVGATPSGGYYYGNAVQNDTFFPARANPGINYAIYQLADSSTGCANKSEFEVVMENCTGILTKKAASTLSLYPNPSSGSIYIESELPIRKIQILNMLGDIVKEEKQINAAVHELLIGDLADGTYLISIETMTGRTMKRLVKM